MKFSDLRLSKPILSAIAAEGYVDATQIQAGAIPPALEGRDVLGCAQTGTGKTAAFALPLLHRIAESKPGKGRRPPRALVLAPTRELAEQIAESFQSYGRNVSVDGVVVYGGVSQSKQVQKLRRGVDIVVATPGRLLDLTQQGHCDFSHIQQLVLDEADRMLDMGFMPDIKRIISHLPDARQTLMFSATMPRAIRQFAQSLLSNPAQITVETDTADVDRIEQAVYHVDTPAKAALLTQLMDSLSVSRAIVFTRTKHGADRVAKQLNRSGTNADAIHGNKSQNARRRVLDSFRRGKVHVLVATDVAARGIDVDGISHIFNFDISREPEGHVHRIGRTARAGAQGKAISFCGHDELPHLRAIERLMQMKIQVIGDGPAAKSGSGGGQTKPRRKARHASKGRAAGKFKAAAKGETPPRGHRKGKRSRPSRGRGAPSRA